MYQPKLPVTGAAIFTLSFTSIYNASLISLLVITLSLILFRFFRLIIKEGNHKIIPIIMIVLIILILTMYVERVISTNYIMKQSKDMLNNTYSQQNTLKDIKQLHNLVTEHRISRIESVNNSEYRDFYKSGEILGIIRIDKISLELPIIEDSTDENLWLGAAHIRGTPQYWEQGNSFLASHNIRYKHILFSRINELEIGDEITISNSNEKYIYKVYEIKIVNANDIECFNRINGDYNLSLVTCTNESDKRYIVYCERT